MIILRQRNYTTISDMQNRHSNGPNLIISSKSNKRYRGQEASEEDIRVLNAPYEGGSTYNKVGARSVNRLKNGSLQYNVRHGDKLKDDANRYTAETHISTKDTSFRDSYRDFLRNEKKLLEDEVPGVDPQKARYRSTPNKNGKLERLTNEDIKRDIRKLARKEGMKKWAKNHKGAIIGGTVGAAALVGGGIALHKHNKKKKEEKNKKDKE